MQNDIEKIFSLVVLDLSCIMIACSKVSEEFDQDNIDRLVALINSFEGNYINMKKEIKKIIFTLVDESENQEINVIETDNGFEI